MLSLNLLSLIMNTNTHNNNILHKSHLQEQPCFFPNSNLHMRHVCVLVRLCSKSFLSIQFLHDISKQYHFSSFDCSFFKFWIPILKIIHLIVSMLIIKKVHLSNTRNLSVCNITDRRCRWECASASAVVNQWKCHKPSACEKNDLQG